MTNLPDTLPNNPYARLCAAAGGLFLAWAGLENEMAAALRNYMNAQAGNSPKGLALACAVFGSMRMKASRDTMKRIAVEHEFGEAAIAFNDQLFTQIGHIETLRDKLAHQFAFKAHEEEDGWWAVTDLVTSRSMKTLKAYKFHNDSVAAAALDVRDATAAVSNILRSGADPIPALPAWRYRPSMLELLTQKAALALPVPLPPGGPPQTE
jgi:hypothetical protein